MLDYLDPIAETTKRQHDTRYTLWFIETRTGLHFLDREAAEACGFGFNVAMVIVPPLYQKEQ